MQNTAVIRCTAFVAAGCSMDGADNTPGLDSRLEECREATVVGPEAANTIEQLRA